MTIFLGLGKSPGPFDGFWPQAVLFFFPGTLSWRQTHLSQSCSESLLVQSNLGQCLEALSSSLSLLDDQHFPSSKLYSEKRRAGDFDWVTFIFNLCNRPERLGSCCCGKLHPVYKKYGVEGPWAERQLTRVLSHPCQYSLSLPLSGSLSKPVIPRTWLAWLGTHTCTDKHSPPGTIPRPETGHQFLSVNVWNTLFLHNKFAVV